MSRRAFLHCLALFALSVIPLLGATSSLAALTVGEPLAVGGQLPDTARAYLYRLSALIGAPVDIISTGPERNQTIIRRHPFDG